MFKKFLKSINSSIINFLQNQIMNLFGKYIYDIDLSDFKNKIIRNLILNKEDLNRVLFSNSLIQLESFKIDQIILDEILFKKKVYKIKIIGAKLEFYINQDISEPKILE